MVAGALCLGTLLVVASRFTLVSAFGIVSRPAALRESSTGTLVLFGSSRHSVNNDNPKDDDAFEGSPQESVAGAIRDTTNTNTKRPYNRRRILQQGISSLTALSTASILSSSLTTLDGSSWVAMATEEVSAATATTTESTTFTQSGKGGGGPFGYQLTIPPNFVQGGKPVKTHLNEANFNSAVTKGYQLGITVDPVKINSLVEFGTPSEVAARVITAELKRDGILDITMGDDPSDVRDGSNIVYYLVDYISDGTRGRKHLYTKTVIHQGNLYVLTGQIKVADETPTIVAEIKQVLQSFAVSAS
jgi:hypothetical protein